MQNRENSLHDDDDGSKGKKKAEGVIGMAAGKYLDTLDHLPKKKKCDSGCPSFAQRRLLWKLAMV